MSEERKIELNKLYNGEQKTGIHLHMGDGSVSKSGTSAGIAITILMYSLLNNIPIKPFFGMTSEIQLDGSLTAIGGLHNKILGSLKAGIKEFIYPKENKKDFDEFYEKYKDDERLSHIKFYEIDHISEAIEIIMEK